MLRTLASVLALAVGASAPRARVQSASVQGPDLIIQLRRGGHVLLMRHAASPIDIPAKAQAEPDNVRPERQLDIQGQHAAAAMGQALEALDIPIGRVLSSPAYRALQTARLARLPEPQAIRELGEAPAIDGPWLQAKAAEAPAPGFNTMIVTHLPNIRAAYPGPGCALADGEALVFRPDGRGETLLLGRVRIEDWPALAAARV